MSVENLPAVRAWKVFEESLRVPDEKTWVV